MLRRRQGGLTLLELLLSLAALTLVLQGVYAWKAAALEEAAIQRTVDGFVLIDEAAYAYHVENGRWPTSLTELRDPVRPLLPALTAASVDPVTNGVGGVYTLAVIAPDLGIRVTTTMATRTQALRVQRSFPHRTLPVAPASADVVFEQRVAPKDSTDHELLVWRDGSRTMTGDLDFDGNQALKVRRVKMQGFDTDGGACTGRGITTKSDGTLMECFNLKWRPVGQSSAAECMWTGWTITNIVRWGQSLPSTSPRGNASATVIGSWCDNGKITHVRTARCTAHATDGAVNGIPNFTVSGCPNLASAP